MKTQQDLRRLLESIDHRGYPAYKETRGEYAFDGYILSIDHVQGDPFASPSNVSIRVGGASARFPREYYAERHRRIALQDFLTRRFHQETERFNRRAGGSGKSGLIAVCDPGQEILERTSCRIAPESGEVTFRLEVGFPANGRTINARELIKILYEFFPICVQKALRFRKELEKEYEDVLFLADDQKYIRERLPELGLCAFVADGSILPRKSGVSSLPMKDAVPFRSPESVRVTLELPHGGSLSGMGVREGITLIVGGGYHGKSTLLQALERGVYDHIRGDGREYVLTDASAVKIRAEDGRCVHRDDISLFIRNLPDERDTAAFSTEDASGSTSQAANVVEAIECGAGTLLIDEDTCATNFMVRDELMQRVISRDKEPITPFLERMRAMYDEMGISCVLVAGSSGAFFEIADTIVQMDSYVPYDITERAKEIAESYAREKAGASEKDVTDASQNRGISNGTALTQSKASAPPVPFSEPSFRRVPLPDAELQSGERVKTKTMGTDGFSINHENVDLRYLEQLVDREQTAALAQLVKYAGRNLFDGRRSIRELLGELDRLLEAKGLEVLYGQTPYCGLAMPRRQEIAACFNRCRFLRLAGK